MINAARQPVILADVEAHRFGLQDQLLKLARKANMAPSGTSKTALKATCGRGNIAACPRLWTRATGFVVDAEQELDRLAARRAKRLYAADFGNARA